MGAELCLAHDIRGWRHWGPLSVDMQPCGCFILDFLKVYQSKVFAAKSFYLVIYVINFFWGKFKNLFLLSSKSFLNTRRKNNFYLFI